MKYAVLKVKKIDGVRHLSLEVIFDSEFVAQGYCDLMNENLSSARIHYVVESVSACSDVVEDDIIKRCKNIANCLYLAEVCLMKNGKRSLEKSVLWFNLAKERSKIAADLLDLI